MTEFLAALSGLLVVGGLLGLVVGLRKVPVVDKPHRPIKRRPWRRLPRRTLLVVSVATVLGSAVALLTGWVIAIVVFPLAAVGLPVLLNAPHERHVIERLEALAEWTRNLAGVIRVGAGLERAFVDTLGSTPPAIRPEVAALVARIRSKWDVADALRLFADDLDDPTGDLVAASLILASQTRGDGLSAILSGLAESVAAEVASRRQLEADRAKPRQNARVLTVITVGALALLALSGQFLDAYRSPAGQLILAGFLAVYAGVLLMMRKMAQVKPLPRFLTGGSGS